MLIEVAKPYLDNKEEEAVCKTIKSGWLSQGQNVRDFEKIFADYVGSRYAVAVTSCTSALYAALRICGIGHGDEVIIPSLSFIATANSVVHCGADPVFVDIDLKTCNIDVEKIEIAITKKTKAIMPVHQMGLPVDLDAVRIIAERHGLIIIEDAACAVGSEYKGKRIGGHGNIACFSFHPRKIITTGEGGIISINDHDMETRLKRFRHHGMSISDIERHMSQKILFESYLEIGFNYRMTDIQAAIGIVQMQKLPEILRKRHAIAEKYNNVFSNIPYICIPHIPDYVRHNYQSYWIEILENSPIGRNDLMQKLLEKGISTRRGIMAIHKEPCYIKRNLYLPNTERIAANSLILPLYPSMSERDTDFVIDCICESLS